mgnify:CR=1 FL=1
MKILLYYSQRKKAEAKELARKYGFCLEGENPDIILCYGGDGTFLKAEADYPGIPKAIIKGSQICKQCSSLSNEEVIEKIKKKKYKIKKMTKIEARAEGKVLRAINDIIVHNHDPRHAIRYMLSVNGKQIGGTIIGDGIVVATPFGASGYYRSITDSVFNIGLGLAFNNSTEASDHLVLDDDSKILLKIIRGPATVYADNQKDSIVLKDGDEVEILKSSEQALLIYCEPYS